MRTEQVSGLDRTDTTDPYGHPVLVDRATTVEHSAWCGHMASVRHSWPGVVGGAVLLIIGVLALIARRRSGACDPRHAWLMVAIGLVAVLSSAIAHFGRRPVRVVHTSSIAPYSRVEEYTEEYIDEPPFR